MKTYKYYVDSFKVPVLPVEAARVVSPAERRVEAIDTMLETLEEQLKIEGADGTGVVTVFPLEDRVVTILEAEDE